MAGICPNQRVRFGYCQRGARRLAMVPSELVPASSQSPRYPFA
jgi:hypothetical protein